MNQVLRSGAAELKFFKLADTFVKQFLRKTTLPGYGFTEAAEQKFFKLTDVFLKQAGLRSGAAERKFFKLADTFVQKMS